MKKLIAMIGAVAMSFGLFAAANPGATSFEAGDAGVEGKTFTPSDPWSWEGEDALKLVEYNGDKYVYTTNRRDSEFAALDTNDQYLNLETGKKTLSRATADGDIFLDQLVKFTGFEEDQEFTTEDGTKIAVWMRSDEGDDAAAEPETTNKLYITVGRLYDSTITPINLQIGADNEYAPDTWYRLTIRKIDTFKSGETQRAGFIVYIDGAQIDCTADIAKDLIENTTAMTEKAKAYMEKGQLFPSFADEENGEFNSIGFQGIGQIDDMIVDANGPDFAQTLDIAPLPPTGALVDKVMVGDVEIPCLDGTYTVAKGATVRVYLKGDEGKYVDPTFKDFENVSGETDFSDFSGIQVKDYVASIQVGEDVIYGKTVEETIAKVQELAVGEHERILVTVLQNCYSQDGSLEFTAETEIEITAGGNWAFDLADGEMTFIGTIADEKTVTVENGGLVFGGAIAAGSSVTADAVTLGDALEVAGDFAAAEITLDGNTITLVGDGAVVSGIQIGKAAFENPADDVVEKQVGDNWVYTLQQFVPVCEIVGGEQYGSLAEALEAATDGQTIKLLDDIVLDTGVVVDKEVTIDFDGKTITATYETTKAAYVPPINVLANGDLTITGNGFIVAWEGDAAAALDSKPVICVEGALTYLNGTLTTGGAADCGLYGVGIFNGGEAEFGDETQGPSITSWFAAVAANNLNAPVAVTINNGSYTQLANGEGQSWSYFCGALYAAAQGTYTINGGTFDGALYSIVTRYNDVATVIDVENGTFADPMLVGEVASQAEVKGTRVVTKDADVELALAGSDHYWFDGTTLGKKTDAVAKIDDDYFMTLPKAIAAAAENDTVTLLKDLELTTKADMIKFPAGFKGTLDLGGKTIERTASNDYVIQVQSGADLTITGTGLVKFEPVKLGYTTSTYAKITGLGTPSSMIDVANNAGLTIAGGTFQTDYCCVKTEELGELSITGGALEILPLTWGGLTFTVMNWGIAEISGGDFDGNVQVCAYTDKGVTYAGDLTIDGGTFQPATVYLLSYNDDAFPVAKVENTIAATFTDPVYVDYGAGDGIEATTTADDTYTTYTLAAIPQVQVAKINDKTYPTLAAAFEDAKGDESVTIELLGNLTEDVNVTGVNAVLDLGDFTLTGAMSVAGTLTIANGTVDFGSNGFQITGGKLTLAADGVLTGWKSSNEVITLTNGADFDIYGQIIITTVGSTGGIAVVIMDDSDGSVVNAYEGCYIESSVTIFKSRCGDGKTGTINVYGGTFTQLNYGTIFYGSKAGPTTFNVVGGTYNMTNKGYMFSNVSGANNTITGLDGNCTAKFSKDPLEGSVYPKGNPIAEGYGAVEGDYGYFMIKKVWDVTLMNGEVTVDTQVVADGACATNVTLAVDGFKGWTNETYTTGFDFTTQIKADLTLYAWIEAAQPLDPEQPKHYNTKEEAEAAAAEMNGEDGTVKPEYIKIPAAAGTSDEAKAAYAGLFKAVADADGNVTIQFTETAAAAIEDEITDAQANVIKPDAEGKAEIETKPGLFYGIAATAEVGTIKGTDPADWQQATGATLKLEVPTVEGTKAFFQIHCQAKDPQSNL